MVANKGSIKDNKTSVFVGVVLLAVSLLSGNNSAHADTQAAGQRLKEKGGLTAATEPAYEPFEFMQGNKLVGFGPDLLHALAERIGVRLDQVSMPLSGILPGLLAGKFDLAATSLTINADRAHKIAFTRPVANVSSVVLVRADNTNIHSLDDLRGKIVGTQQASASERELVKLQEQLVASGQGFGDFKRYQAFPEIQAALLTQQIDALSLPAPMAAVWMQKRPGAFRIATPWNEQRFAAWATRPDEVELRDYLNTQLDALQADGTVGRLQQKWFGTEMPTPNHGYLPEGAL